MQATMDSMRARVNKVAARGGVATVALGTSRAGQHPRIM
jgi:hypothetical protein